MWSTTCFLFLAKGKGTKKNKRKNRKEKKLRKAGISLYPDRPMSKVQIGLPLSIIWCTVEQSKRHHFRFLCSTFTSICSLYIYICSESKTWEGSSPACYFSLWSKQNKAFVSVEGKLPSKVPLVLWLSTSRWEWAYRAIFPVPHFCRGRESDMSV